MQKESPFEVKALLGGMAPAQFMATHWQTRWRLVRQAMRGFQNLVGRPQFMALATREDVETRLVIREGARYTLEHGPFSARRLRALPPARWTLLVQGLNLHVAGADELLRRFNFVPYARLDDVLASYAVPGGGVGPHVDSYDVFLVQGLGQRRWRVSTQRDLEPRAGSALEILRRFRPQASWVLDPGDMLYLPPRVAHDGVAVSECVTYSIGFRAPQALEIAREFLIYLEDQLNLTGRFEDARRRAAGKPGRLPDDLLRWGAGVIGDIRWARADIQRFLGIYLSTPGASVVFERPVPALRRAAFRRAAASRGLRLSPRSLMLYGSRGIFLNGDLLGAARHDAAALRTLADRRRLAPPVSPQLADLLYPRYRNGEVFPI